MRYAWMLIVLMVGIPQAFAASAKAVIKGTTSDSPVLGEAQLTDTAKGLKVDIQLTHVPPGKHGLHIHQNGNCGDAGNAAGGHFNPSSVPHGFLPKDGPAQAHPGDMGNIQISQDGTGTLTVTLPSVSLQEGVHAVGSRAIVLHEKEDDFSQPTGNAGGRIGCGVIAVEVPGT